jgi:hypothetical protein
MPNKHFYRGAADQFVLGELDNGLGFAAGCEVTATPRRKVAPTESGLGPWFGLCPCDSDFALASPEVLDETSRVSR